MQHAHASGDGKRSLAGLDGRCRETRSGECAHGGHQRVSDGFDFRQRHGCLRRRKDVTRYRPDSAAWCDHTNTMPSTAIANRLATRATALLMPDATPAWSPGTEPITVAVSGATMIVMPRPSTASAGKLSFRYLF